MRTLTERMVSLPARRSPSGRGATATPLLLATAALLAALALLAVPSGGAAQSVTVGGVGGIVRSRQILVRASDSERRNGFVAGAWMDVQSPKPLLHFLAEAAYARRGGRFPLAGPSGLIGEVESDWVTFTVAPTLHVALGPVGAYAYAGPTLELHVRTRSAAALRNAYAEPSDQGLAASAGAGLEARLPGWAVRGEARVVEGLSAAYSGSAGDIRHRSVEVVLRVGRKG
ncbi:MAG: hypothetical protein FIA95_04040, partial [Gemmatimonadetes bacterium]|nr:hypothetical protein [Gemmatimonadota bacterium]